MGEEIGRSILLVDDEPDLCEMLSLQFTRRGYRVLTAHDGQRAMEILGAEVVDIIVTDIRMPRFDGMQLLDSLKGQDPCTPLVILISAYADLSVAAALSRGAEALFPKPFRLAELVAVIDRLLTPAEIRWATAPECARDRCLEIHLSSLEDSDVEGILKVGRGGFCVAVTNPPASPEEVVSFDVRFEQGPIPALRGAGLVRWVKYPAHGTGRVTWGIEFVWLDDACRDPVIAWLRAERPRPYVPILTKS
ncbi:MAG TPA: response regulator [Candidatus Hydrogenedentes bacterium]|nr:response regulator [Candidatus Hydrogenedentota bacterium]HPG67538.1 response regulator [Candidatus Hydrogenedentota bacterium]